MNYRTLLELAVASAGLAAKEIMDVYQAKDFGVRIKTDNSPVTRADILAHHAIVEKLHGSEYDFPILSEESASTEWKQRRNWRTYWLIDPLDGTKEFVDRNDEFTINIALIHDGEPVIGVVVAPALSTAYMAAKGIGAFKSSDHHPPAPIRVRPVPIVNGNKQLTLVVGRRSYSTSLDKLYDNLPAFEKLALGSSLKTCQIAEGKADLYPRFGHISEWDTAAAQCILECAGGAVTNLELSPLRYNTKESLLNPEFIAWGDPTVHWKEYL